MSLSIPVRPTLYHGVNFSSSRPMGVLLELGIASTKKRKTYQEEEEDPKIDVVTIDWDTLKIDSVLAKLNPQKRLPFFYDPKSDVKLTESGGLVQYLLETYDTQHQLYPATVGDPTRADYLQLLHFGPATAYHIAVHLLFPGKDFDTKKKEWKDIVVPTLEGALDKFGGPYLLGEKLTAADVCLAYDLHTAASAACAGELFDPFPKLKAYHEKLKERASYQELYGTSE